MYSFFRCHSCAWGSTSASAKRRICVRISDSVSSSPVSPKVVTAGWAAISSRQARLEAVAGAAHRSGRATCSSKRWISARGTPSAASRTVSTWLMGMPPASCARYSPKAAARDQPLHLAEPPLGLEPLGPAQHLPQRLDIGRDPREPVRGRLRRVQAAGRLHRLAHPGLGQMQQPLRRRHRLRAALQIELRGRRRLGACAHAGHDPTPSAGARDARGGARAIVLHCTIARPRTGAIGSLVGGGRAETERRAWPMRTVGPRPRTSTLSAFRANAGRGGDRDLTSSRRRSQAKLRAGTGRGTRGAGMTRCGTTRPSHSHHAKHQTAPHSAPPSPPSYSQIPG